MSIAVQNTFVMIPLDSIVAKLNVRRLSSAGLKRLQESMQWAGFLDNYPLIVAPLEDGGYELIDGNHRYESAKSLGIETVPCIVKDALEDAERYMLAFQSNGAAESVVPSTLVTYAEFIWARIDEGYTQQKIAKMMGSRWGRTQVANYAALKNICLDAWSMIVTTFDSAVTDASDEAVTYNVTVVTFSEGLLRSILPLTADQQVELVSDLAAKKIEKGKLKSLAESYKSRNEMKDYALQQLGPVGEPYTTHLTSEIESGGYDTDWKQANHPKLVKLIASIRDEYAQKNSIQLIHGDFYEEVKKLEDGCIDLILTDPPYNISRDNVFQLEGRSNISQNFGAWDKHDHQDFTQALSLWAIEWARLLRHQGSGYVFTQDSYLSVLRNALEQAGLHVKATLIWHKSNPGTQVVKTNFKSSIEYLLFFTKGEGGHTFNWLSDDGSIMHNFIECSICGGNERIKDSKGDTLHPTQKPEAVLKHLMDISSNRGDMVFDGFMGVASVGAVAKKAGRKFIGIEQEKTFYDAGVRRLSNGQ